MNSKITLPYQQIITSALSTRVRWLLIILALLVLFGTAPLKDAMAADIPTPIVPSTSRTTTPAAHNAAPPGASSHTFPNLYYFVDWANPVWQTTLTQTWLNSQCDQTITINNIPTNEWYAWGPTAGTYRNDEPYGPANAILYSRVPNPATWYYTAKQAGAIPGHPDVITNSTSWSNSDWISYDDFVSGSTGLHNLSGTGAIFFFAEQSTYYQGFPDHDCPDNDDGGWASAYNDKFLQTTIARVYFDLFAPTTSPLLAGTMGTSGWYRSTVTVSLSSSDPKPDLAPASGVASRLLDGTPYTGARTYSTQGTVTIAYRATDNAGNIATTESLAFKIDSVAPVGTFSQPAVDTFISGTVDLSGTTSDATSGVATVEFSYDGSDWQPVTGTTSWTYSWDTTTVPDGDYNLKLRVTDVAGNVHTTSHSVVVDNTGPTTTITEPDQNEFVSGQYTITGTADDADGSGVASVDISFDGGTTWLPADGSETWSYEWDTTAFPDGPITILARSVDALGNIGVPDSVSTHIDNTAPSVVITNPGDNELIIGDPPIDGGADDGDLGSGVCEVELSFDGGATWVSAIAVTLDWSEWTFDWDTSTLSDGLVTIMARAVDCAGNSSDTIEVPIYIDNTPPPVDIVTPTENEFVSGTEPITGTAGDDNPNGHPVAYVEISFDGGTTWIIADGKENWSYNWDTTPFPDGPITIVARATDEAGLTGPTDSVTVMVDNTGPTVTIETPDDQQIVGGDTPVEGGADDGDNGSGVCAVELSFDGGTTWVNATAIDPDWSSWTYNWDTGTASNGVITVLARAVDCEGNVGDSVPVEVIVDNQAPTITIIDPIDNQVLTGETYPIEGTATDGAGGSGICGIEISFDEGATWLPVTDFSEIEIEPGVPGVTWTIEWDFTDQPGGPVTIMARAIDCTGLESDPDNVAVYIDNVPPAVSILAPAESAVVRQTVEVSGTAGDPNGLGNPVALVELSFDNGQSWIAATGTESWSYQWDTTLFNDGNLSIQARATDTAGLVSEIDTQTVLIDNTPPVPVIATPADGITLGGIINLGGSADDGLIGSGVALVELSFDNGVTWVPATGTTSWSISWDTTQIPDGDYPVQARATDVAGNVGDTVTVNIQVDNTPPGVNIITPESGSFVARMITINGTAEDLGSGIEKVEVSLDGGQSWLEAQGTLDWALEWNTLLVPDGPYTIMARSIDTLGQQSTPDTTNVVVDNTAPAVQFIDPDNNETVRGWFDIVCSADDGALGSGVKLIEISVDNAASWIPLESLVCAYGDWNTSDMQLQEDYPLHLRATDKMDNVGATEIAVKIDNSIAPTPEAPTQPAPVMQDPAVTKSGSPTHATEGTTVNWNVVISNPHDSPTRANVQFVDPVNHMFTMRGVTIVGNATYRIDGNNVYFTVGSLQPGESVHIVIETIVNDNAYAGEMSNAIYHPEDMTNPVTVAHILLYPHTLPDAGGPTRESAARFERTDLLLKVLAGGSGVIGLAIFGLALTFTKPCKRQA